MTTIQDYSRRLHDAMNGTDRWGAAEVVKEALESGILPEQVLTEILDPALTQVGHLWNQKQVSLAQTFVAAKIAEDTLLTCRPEAGAAPGRTRGVVVIGNIEDDFHSLGRRIVVSFLQAAGWEVHDLGNDVLAEAFVDKALEVNAAVVGVSAMMQTTALNIRKVRDLIDRRGLGNRLRLAVGGAVFNWRPELVDVVGGDGTARNAAGVDELLAGLQAEVQGGVAP